MNHVMAPALSSPPALPHGALMALQGHTVAGWAWDPAQPDARLAIEVMIDGVFVALVRADQAQPDPAAGDGFHGFAARLIPDWLTPGCVVSARIANGGPWLAGTAVIEQTPALVQGVPSGSALPVAPGQVWYTGGLVVRGWAWNPNDPAHVRHVAAYDTQNRCVARAVANIWHPAFAQHLQANHGFELMLPWHMADGKTHTLTVYDDAGQRLNDGEIRVCVHPSGLYALLMQEEAYALPAAARQHSALLQQLAFDYDRRYPRSAGFSHYALWHAHCGTPPAGLHTECLHAPRLNGSVTTVCVLLTGSTHHPADEARSMASLQAQSLPADQWQVVDLETVLNPTADDGSSLLDRLSALAQSARLLVPLQRGDTLAPHALATFCANLLDDGIAWGYADCDHDTPDGQRSHPWFKPAWDETLFYGVDLITPGVAIRSEAWRAGLQRLAHSTHVAPVHWHSLLAAVVVADHGAVRHLPWVLYHRRAGLPVAPYQSLPDPVRQQAMQWLLNERSTGASVTEHPRFPGLLQVQWPVQPPHVAALPRVSLIIPTRDQLTLLRACIDGLLQRTTYPDLEILVVDNESQHPDTLAYLESLAAYPHVRVLRYASAFNYAAINNWAVEQATGTVIGLINNDIDVLEPDWLQHMVAQLLRPGVGAVGAKLRWPNGMVQHAGVVVGVYDLATHVGNHWLHTDPGYLGMNQLDRQYSAVTAACLLVHRDLYERLGGLNAQRYAVTFNDVDFCLRICQTGYQVVLSAQAELIHAESASRGKEDTPAKYQRARREQGHFREDWAAWHEKGDPFYHPALGADFAGSPFSGLAMPPRPREHRTLLVTNNRYEILNASIPQ